MTAILSPAALAILMFAEFNCMDSLHCILSWTRSRAVEYETVMRYKRHKIWRKLVGLAAVWVAQVVGIVAASPSQSHLPTLDHSIACLLYPCSEALDSPPYAHAT